MGKIIITGGNFSNGKTPPPGDEYRNCNFSYTEPLTEDGKKVGHQLFPGDDMPRTFHRCNMRNCIPPKNAALTKCITPIMEVFESEAIKGKECRAVKLYGHTDKNTREAKHTVQPQIISKPLKERIVTFKDKVSV